MSFMILVEILCVIGVSDESRFLGYLGVLIKSGKSNIKLYNDLKYVSHLKYLKGLPKNILFGLAMFQFRVRCKV